MKHVFSIAVLILGFGYVAQAQSPRAFEQAAATALDNGDYYAAFKYFGKVLEMEPKRADIMIRYAEAARLYGAYRDAETHYESAFKQDESTANKYHTAIFGLAMVKKSLGKYEEALRLFEKYTARPDKDPTLSKKATEEIGVCEWAMEKITNPDRLVEVVPLDDLFNTGDSEMGMVQKGDTLFFGTLRETRWGDVHVPERPLFQVMMSVRGQKPVLAPFNKDKQHTALPTFTADGKWMVVPYGEYVGETEVRCHLYLCKWDNGQWQQPIPLPPSVNVASATQTQPYAVKEADGYYSLYYVSDAPGGKGGKDLWKVRFSAMGNFAAPENLIALNTPSDEVTPYFDLATQSLYFSSTGYQNLGGFDVYQSKWQDFVWQTPKHLSAPINSSFNDLYYVVNDPQSSLLTSNRIGAAQQGDEACCYDLFQVNIKGLKLQLSAFEEGSEKPLDNVAYTLLEGQQATSPRFAHATQPVEYAIQRDKTYKVLASKEGYAPDTIQVAALDLDPSRTEIKERLFLNPVQLQLAVQVFNQLDKAPLQGVKVLLIDPNGSVKDQVNLDRHNGPLTLKGERKRDYLVVAQKEGFASDTLLVTAEETERLSAVLSKQLYLTPMTLNGLLPLSIYFDNNVPPRTANERVPSYDLTYAAYLGRQGEFIKNFTQNIADPLQRDAAAQRLQEFFERDVKGGFMKLEHFADNLDLFLDNGYEVEIMVKGFASPLASDEYNLALTRRRIVSVKNYLRTTKDGMYQTHILNNQLKISTAPLGETAVTTGVNDNKKQIDQSVFSVEASKERRAEIIEVRLTKI